MIYSEESGITELLVQIWDSAFKKIVFERGREVVDSQVSEEHLLSFTWKRKNEHNLIISYVFWLIWMYFIRVESHVTSGDILQHAATLVLRLNATKKAEFDCENTVVWVTKQVRVDLRRNQINLTHWNVRKSDKCRETTSVKSNYFWLK